MTNAKSIKVSIVEIHKNNNSIESEHCTVDLALKLM